MPFETHSYELSFRSGPRRPQSKAEAKPHHEAPDGPGSSLLVTGARGYGPAEQSGKAALSEQNHLTAGDCALCGKRSMDMGVNRMSVALVKDTDWRNSCLSEGLFIGIDRYASPKIAWLGCARWGAMAVHGLFADLMGRETVLLTDERVTLAAIQGEFWKLEAAAPDDVVVMAFSGHDA